jgi:alkylation response protein AidB-like acyl-CoA dehydrogenase
MNRNVDDLFEYPGQLIDDESASVVRLVRQWADKEIISKRMEYRENYDRLFDEKRKKLNLDIGLQKLVIPADLGGFGWNSLSNVPGMLSILTEIGRADAALGVLSASTCTALAMIAMEHHQSKKLTSSIAPAFAGSNIRTPCPILPGPGIAGTTHPLFKGRAILAEAKAVKDGYIISGTSLRPLFAGSIADLFCVVCAGKNNKPCIAFVPEDTQGVTRSSPLLTTGLNACMNTDVTFHEVNVPKENVIEEDGIVEEFYIWLNLFLGGVSVGAAKNFFELISDWGDTRVIKGGTTLKENPLCASVLADVAEEIALAKLLLFDLARIIASPGEMSAGTITRTFTFAEMIGSRVQQGVLRAMNRGLELMGSAGYSKEWHVEKQWRDVKTIQSVLCGVGAEAPVKMDTARFFFNCTEI